MPSTKKKKWRLVDYPKIGVDKAKNNQNLVCLLKRIKDKQNEHGNCTREAIENTCKKLN